MANLNRCIPSVLNTGACGGASYLPCVGFDTKGGARSKPPYNTELPYVRNTQGFDPGLVRRDSTGDLGSFYNCFGDVGWALDADSNVFQRLIGNLANSIRGHDFNPGASLGEMNETMGMMGSASSRIANLAKRLPRLIPSSAWLEAVYGWMPLWADLHSGAQFLASAHARPRRKTYRAIARTDGSAISSAPSVWIASGSVKRIYYAVAHVSESGDNLAYTGIIDPLATAWELTPYSFVVDWFVPIGNYLSARNFLASLEATGCYGYKTRYGVFASALDLSGFTMMSPIRKRGVAHERFTGLPALPLPSFTPLDRVLSNWRHLVDGFALASQAFGNIRVR